MHESLYITKCLELVEQKLKWGDVKLWTDGDFQKLSEEIFDASNIRISIPTLKRLFGRKKVYGENYNPQIETKNALVIYLGYKSWQAFKTSQAALETPEAPAVAGIKKESNALGEPDVKQETLVLPQPVVTEKPSRQHEPVFSKKQRLEPAQKLLLVGLALFAVACLLYYRFKPAEKYDFSFEGKHLQGQSPVTAVFNYDIRKIPSDSVFIFFETAYKIKKYLPKDKNTITQWYELPGIFRVKLLADNKVLATQNVHVESKDWVSIVIDDGHTKYARLPYAPDSGGIKYVSAEKVRLVYDTSRYWIQHRLSKNFGVDGDNFSLEFRAKNDAQKEAIQCNDIAFELEGDNNNIRLHFLEPGCTRWAKLQFSDVALNGEFSDLSAFGRTISDWHTYRLTVKNKVAEVFFDNKLIFSSTYKEPIGNIKSLITETLQTGALDYVRLYNKNGDLAYADEFED